MRILRLSAATVLCLTVPVAGLPRLIAQEPGDEGRQRERVREAPAQRAGGIPRDQVLEGGDEAGQGTEEGMPQFRPEPDGRRVAPFWLPPDRHHWKLGVHAYNSDTGVVVTQVLPGSAARRAGMERGDRIVTVGGFQVGWIQNRLYPLGAELQRQAGHHGHVTLLVQNVRTNGLLNLDVHLGARGRQRSGPD